MAIKVVIADDHEVVRTGLKSLFAGTDIKIVGEAATGEAALKQVAKHEPDVVLLDIRMSDGDGLNTLGRIKLDRPAMPILIFSTYDNPTYVARAVALGANGYILKGTSKDKLIEAIRQAAEGQSVWTPLRPQSGQYARAWSRRQVQAGGWTIKRGASSSR
jgi:DNA-binding NarL/FixJ family response regulator